MRPDLDLFGVYVPMLLPLVLGCYGVFLAIRRMFSAAGLYRHVWHPALFNVALFFTLLGTAVLLQERLSP
ncbi:DUF1656 domain-containing protein [Rhodovibrio salinarum]|uniref:DUF1656 domain-containing protein n=1 Tax=Rhodovibrio salinarum TaxID=1087 RepID=A0A934QJG6_9PROT|nr:DUF1656 domain-containing protein [Rhodovibrio salinarum]MBK1697983.1 DUF1656 domain-containing protein [Rhodovibrio salinarum]